MVRVMVTWCKHGGHSDKERVKVSVGCTYDDHVVGGRVVVMVMVMIYTADEMEVMVSGDVVAAGDDGCPYPLHAC